MTTIRFLTANEMYDRYQVSRAKLYQLVGDEGLPVLRLGNGPRATRRFDPRAVERWEKRQTDGLA